MPKQKRKTRRKRASRLWGGYSAIPKTALAIFIIMAALIKSGASDKLEAAAHMCVIRLETAVSAVRGHGDAPPDSEPDPEPEPMTEPISDAPAGQLSFESAAPVFFSPALPEPATPVTIDGSSGGYKGSGSVYTRNETKYDIDVPSLLSAPNKVSLSGDKVQVLIMHTHGTEAYTPTAENMYEPSDTDRTTDKRFNVLRVGQEICDILNSRGILTVHSETLNDSPAYSGSYNRALQDITSYIKDNPSIKMVIDVHRDAMISASGVKYKAVADIDGVSAAQLMLVCGTDAGGLSHDGWRDNLSFQLKLQDMLNTRHPGLMRPLNIRAARFNQHVTPGSMLLEVGTCGNTLEEALFSARLFAEGLADMLLG